MSESHYGLLEELRVSEEELRAQAEELAEATLAATRERERYELLFDEAPVPYLVTDRAANIRQANRAAGQELGCRPDRLIGKPLTSFVALRSRSHFRQELHRVLRGSHATSVVVKLISRLGRERPFPATVGVVERDGEVVELRWLLSSNVAPAPHAPGRNRPEHFDRMAREKARAERMAREMAELLAWASHELRTPAASIGGYADILALGIRGPLNPDQQAILTRIQQAQSHLVALLEDLVTFARAGTGNLRIEVADVPLEPVIERLLAIVEPQAAANDLRVSLAIPRGIMLRSDGERLLQILLNLVTNAIKFTPAGGRIDLSCDPDGDAVVILVRDTGAGIAEEERERIFRPFVQLDTPSQVRVSGVGLGLAISRELARAMRGDLTCTAARDGGSVFVLRLPRSMGIAPSAAHP